MGFVQGGLLGHGNSGRGKGAAWDAGSALLSFCLRVAPHCRGFTFGARARIGKRVSPECCDATTASCGWYGVPERFRANCAFGGRPMRGAALSHPHRVTARVKHTLKRGDSTITR
ncbi:hypothetical protein BN940_15211 [Castellaniella defragrans 65Phen]|uniref:Uncharacterized protein n=1 Tax=Castellaniella defragrans (strain DSM 12143 / CCUG 39792 / 65Phen) TaxID=1437824 RepID=W8X5U4_CASD6|nr:hypothetical protein BN940_15211 [Castellaniella defragrans 65Phen]